MSTEAPAQNTNSLIERLARAFFVWNGVNPETRAQLRATLMAEASAPVAAWVKKQQKERLEESDAKKVTKAIEGLVQAAPEVSAAELLRTALRLDPAHHASLVPLALKHLSAEELLTLVAPSMDVHLSGLKAIPQEISLLRAGTKLYLKPSVARIRKGWEYLAAIPALRLRLQVLDMDLADLSHASANLVALEVPQLDAIHHIETLAQLQHLRVLTLRKFDLADLAWTRGLPLTELHLWGYASPDLDLTPLTALSALRVLNLNGRRVAVKPLLTMTQLESLEVQGCVLDDLQAFSSFRALHTLDVANSTVTDLTPLATLPLRSLTISHTRITDLTPILELPTLQSLSAYGLRLPETQLAALQQRGVAVFR